MSVQLDVGQRVSPMRLIAGHLYNVASFLESLDQSIEMGHVGPDDPSHDARGEHSTSVSPRAAPTSKSQREVRAEHTPVALETIKEIGRVSD